MNFRTYAFNNFHYFTNWTDFQAAMTRAKKTRSIVAQCLPIDDLENAILVDQAKKLLELEPRGRA